MKRVNYLMYVARVTVVILKIVYTIMVSGILEYNPSKIYLISAACSGVVQQVLCSTYSVDRPVYLEDQFSLGITFAAVQAAS